MSEKQEKQYKVVDGTSYDAKTSDEVIKVLERARRYGERIRLFYGDVETGECWMDEWDMMGRVGRSMGPVSIPILLNNVNSSFGGAILDNCIIKITIGKAVEYVHPKFHLPEMTIAPSTESGYAESVFFDGKIQANFKKQGQAQRYVAFMKGERNSK